MDFKSLKDLNKYIQSKIDKTLNKEVAEVVKDQISESVNDVVYGAGEPVMYVRRGIYPGSLGLGDETQMHHTVNDGILKVTDDADFNMGSIYFGYSYSDADMSKSLAENIEYGYGSKSYWYNKPRGFIKDAKNNLEQNNKHIEAMKNGLIINGIKIK